MVIAGPFGFGFPVVTSASGPNQTITLSMALLDPNNGNSFLQTQQLAGGSSLSVSLNNSLSTVGTVGSPVTIAGGSDTGTTVFHPLASGQTTISVVQPSGYTLPGENTLVTATVN